MEYLYYKVGNHLFAIAAPQKEAAIVFLSSYERFRVEPGGGRPLFLLELRPAPQWMDLPVYTEFDLDESHCIVRRSATDYRFELHPAGADVCYMMECDARFRRGCMNYAPHSPSFSYALNSFLMMLYAFATADQQTLLLHASVVECGGRGYVFQGKSGTGKSTHSQLWLDHVEGAALLNDDNPVLRIEEGQLRVYGSPWSGKTPCYVNRSVPAGALVRLVQAPENVIRRLRPAEAFASLLPSCSTMKWDTCLYRAVCETVGEAVQMVASYELRCRPDEAAARLCHQEVAHG